MAKMKYYQLAIDDENDVADLYIFGDITKYHWDEQDKGGWDIVKELQAVKASSINVHINSYGGEVSEGLAIYNTLKNSDKKVTTICDGFACSAASVIFMAGSERVMNQASLLMIHNAWTFAMGDAEELRKAADDIETITQASTEAYKAVAKISEKKIKELMDNESWILPEDAVKYGFATKIAEPDDEEDEAKQSAFRVIMGRLTAPERSAVELDTEGIAESVSAKVAEKLEAIAKAAGANKEPEAKEAVTSHGWEKFFK